MPERYGVHHDGMYGKGPICLECRCRPPAYEGIPQIKHHKRCLTGQWEDARRNPKPSPPRKIKPFRPRLAGDRI